MFNASTHGLWAKVYGSIFDHPKTIAIAAQLTGVPKEHARDVAVCQLIRLICWARSNRTDGRVDVLEPEDFARILRSSADPVALREIWLSSGYVDDRRSLHEFSSSHISTRTPASAPASTHPNATHAPGREQSREEQIKPPTPLQGDPGFSSSTVGPRTAAASTLDEVYRQWISIRDSRRLPWIPFEQLEKREQRAFKRLLILCRDDVDLSTKALRRFHGLSDRWVEQRGFDVLALAARVDQIVALVLPVEVLQQVTAAKLDNADPPAPPGSGVKVMQHFLESLKAKRKKP